MALFAGFSTQGHAAQSLDAPFALLKTTAPTGFYWEQNGSNACGSGASSSGGTSSSGSGSDPAVAVCKIDFAAPPAGRYLVLEHVACNLLTNYTSLADVSLATAAGTNETRLLPLVPTLETPSGLAHYSLNESVLYPTRGVTRIVLHTLDLGTLSLTCQISGHMNSLN